MALVFMMTAGPLASMVPLWMRLPGTQGEELKRTQSNQWLHVRSYLSLCKFAFLVIWKFHFTESSISCSVSACFLSFMKGGITTSILCARACVHEHVCQQCNSSQQHMKAEKSSLVFRATLFFFFFEGEMSHGSGSLKETSHNPQLSQCV